MDLDRIYERIAAAITTDPVTHRQNTELVQKIVRNPSQYLNDCYWPGLSLNCLLEVLSDDKLECSEYVASEAALVWLTRTTAIRANYKDPSCTAVPCYVNNLQHAAKVLDCLRIKGLYFFFWSLVLQPWYTLLEVRPPSQADLSEAIAEDNVDDYFSDTLLSPRANSFSSQKVTGWQLLSFPPDAISLKQGCYIIQKSCGYCEEPEVGRGWGSNRSLNEGNWDWVEEPQGMMTVRIEVDKGQQLPVLVLGECDTCSLRVLHACLVFTQHGKPTATPEFVSLYCTSVGLLSEQLERYRKDYDIQLAVFV